MHHCPTCHFLPLSGTLYPPPLPGVVLESLLGHFSRGFVENAKKMFTTARVYRVLSTILLGTFFTYLLVHVSERYPDVEAFEHSQNSTPPPPCTESFPNTKHTQSKSTSLESIPRFFFFCCRHRLSSPPPTPTPTPTPTPLTFPYPHLSAVAYRFEGSFVYLPSCTST